MKNAWPVKAQALGGRHFRGDYVDQNFDNYAVEYTFDDGTQVLLRRPHDVRALATTCRASCTARRARASSARRATFPASAARSRVRSRIASPSLGRFPQPEQNPYALEWKDLIEAITDDKPYNEVPRAVEASLVTNMGRMAAHTGQEITYDQIVECPHEMAPGVADFTINGPAPVMPDSEGRYPVPTPGVDLEREYGTKA